MGEALARTDRPASCGTPPARMDERSAAQDPKRYHAPNLEFHNPPVHFVDNVRLKKYRRLSKELLLFGLRRLYAAGGFALPNTEHRAVGNEGDRLSRSRGGRQAPARARRE